jgi:hypothetical protein
MLNPTAAMRQIIMKSQATIPSALFFAGDRCGQSPHSSEVNNFGREVGPESLLPFIIFQKKCGVQSAYSHAEILKSNMAKTKATLSSGF